MAKKRDYNYANTRTERCGQMKCESCGKQIESGQFRYFMACDKWYNDTGYVTFHRSCTEDDPNWKRLDAEAAAHIKYCADKRAACIAFRAKWGVTALDELIDELRLK